MPREAGRQNEAHSQDNAVLLAWSAYLFAASAGGILGLNVTPGPDKDTVEATVEELEVELAERMEGSLLRGEWRAVCGVLRAAGEIPGALFRFHCQDNGQRDMRQWPLAVAARPHRCRNQLHAAILGTSRGSSNRRKRRRSRWRCRRNSRSRRSGGIRKKDIVCCNIVMTLTMATAPPHRWPPADAAFNETFNDANCNKLPQKTTGTTTTRQRGGRGGADNCNGVEQGWRSVQEDNASHVTNT